MSAAPASPRLFERVWMHRWLLVACLLVSIAATNIALSFYPPRYRSQTSILVVPTRVPDEYVHLPKNGEFDKRIATIQQQILSRTRLERIINEFNLYADERKHGVIEDVVQRMRNDITVQIVGDDAFVVRFDGDNPRTVMEVTERLASLFIEENLNDRANLAEGTHQFLSAQLGETRRLLDEKEAALDSRKKTGHPPSTAERIEYDVLQQQYKDLLNKSLIAETASDIERRQIGEQFKLLEAARIPEEPIAPNRVAINAGGAVAGLGLGIVLIGLTSRRRRMPVVQKPEDAHDDV